MIEQQRIGVDHPTCPYCKDAVAPVDDKTACAGCMAWLHAACWNEHGACSACGGEQPLTGDGVKPAPRARARAVAALTEKGAAPRVRGPFLALGLVALAVLLASILVLAFLLAPMEPQFAPLPPMPRPMPQPPSEAR